MDWLALAVTVGIVTVAVIAAGIIAVVLMNRH